MCCTCRVLELHAVSSGVAVTIFCESNFLRFLPRTLTTGHTAHLHTFKFIHLHIHAHSHDRTRPREACARSAPRLYAGIAD